MTSQQLNLQVRHDNKLDKSDLTKKLLYKAFMGFCAWFEALLEYSYSSDNKSS